MEKEVAGCISYFSCPLGQIPGQISGRILKVSRNPVQYGREDKAVDGFTVGGICYWNFSVLQLGKTERREESGNGTSKQSLKTLSRIPASSSKTYHLKFLQPSKWALPAGDLRFTSMNLWAPVNLNTEGKEHTYCFQRHCSVIHACL